MEQVLVRVPEHVVRDDGAVERQPIEGVDEVEQRRFGQPLLVAPGDVAENPGETVRVGLRETVEDLL